MSVKQRHKLIDISGEISITRQCELLEINRSTLYYHPAPPNPEELQIKQLIDIIYTKKPIYGHRKITEELMNIYGIRIDRKTTLKYMQAMGIQAVYPKPNLSKPAPEHTVYPYLLKNLEIKNRDHVWSTDITYIPMQRGFMYLTAVIDWYSRYVLSWELSDTLEIDFVLEVSKRALKQSKPLIMNSDQGSHYTSPKYTKIFLDAGVAISMDHKGRCFDNIFVERLWRSVKYELIYINEFRNPKELRIELMDYFNFYNNERYHQSLDYQTPAQVYFATKPKD